VPCTLLPRSLSGQFRWLKLGTLPFKARTSRVTGFLGPGEQASPGEGIDTSMWMVSTFLDSIMSNNARFSAVLALLGGSGTLAEPMKVVKANPHYYFYQGKPILLITWI
jgi:hypothetical protein